MASYAQARNKWVIDGLPEGRLFPTDTKAIVGSVLLAVAFSANMQIAERLDTATVGGIIPWIGLLFAGLWFPTACFYFGLTGGLIVATFNPIIAVLTATGPLAPVHFTINWAYNIPFALLAYQHLKRSRSISFRKFLGLCVVGSAFAAFSLIPIWWFLFQFSPIQIAGLWLWAMGISVPHAFLGWYFIGSLTRSGILDQ